LAGLLFHAHSKGGEFEIIHGAGRDVCLAYKQNLESFDESKIKPFFCERPLNEEFPDFSRPPTRNLDISQHKELYKDVLSYLGNVSRHTLLDESKFAELLAHERKFNRLSEYTERIDIDGDGVGERIASFRGGLCRLPDGTPQNYYTFLLVLGKDGRMVDRERTRRLLGVPGRRYSTMQVFAYKRRTYFDLWASAQRYDDRDILYVYRVDGNRRRNVCQLKYYEQGVWK
jgi:hypothetical protein